MYHIVKSYFQLIRSKNLLFLLLIQKLLEYSVVYPILKTFGFQESNHWEYALLNIASILIASGGYIINDYFDIEIDKINKPSKVTIGTKISKKSALNYYFLLTSIGLFVGLILSFKIQSFTLGLIFLFTVGLLWFYSSSYKQKPLIGNIVISILSALSLFIVSIISISTLKNEYGMNLLSKTPIPTTIYAWIGGFSFFAFIMTLIREIIKDMEDIEGDNNLGCKTLPLFLGIKATKWLTSFLILTTIFLLFLVDYLWIPFEGTLSFWYILFALIVPLLILIGMIIKAKKDCCFSKASTLAKLIMLMGIFYTIIFNFLQSRTFGIPFFEIFIVK